MGIPARSMQIRGYPDYLIFEDGKVFSNKTNKFLKFNIGKKGYPTVELFNDNGSKRKLVHRLVAEAFIPNEENLPFINHRDENPGNPSASNLEWCTAKYNSNYGNCQSRRVSRTDFSKQTYKETAIRNSMARRRPVQQILNGKTIAEFESSAEAGRQTGLNYGHINECCKNTIRKTVGGYGWRYKEEE